MEVFQLRPTVRPLAANPEYLVHRIAARPLYHYWTPGWLEWTHSCVVALGPILGKLSHPPTYQAARNPTGPTGLTGTTGLPGSFGSPTVYVRRWIAQRRIGGEVWDLSRQAQEGLTDRMLRQYSRVWSQVIAAMGIPEGFLRGKVLTGRSSTSSVSP